MYIDCTAARVSCSSFVGVGSSSPAWLIARQLFTVRIPVSAQDTRATFEFEHPTTQLIIVATIVAKTGDPPCAVLRTVCVCTPRQCYAKALECQQWLENSRRGR